jgi:hypothetical protein
MNPLLSVTLFWAFLSTAMALLGYACIKYGVYTSGNSESKTYLEV